MQCRYFRAFLYSKMQEYILSKSNFYKLDLWILRGFSKKYFSYAYEYICSIIKFNFNYQTLLAYV